MIIRELLYADTDHSSFSSGSLADSQIITRFRSASKSFDLKINIKTKTKTKPIISPLLVIPIWSRQSRLPVSHWIPFSVFVYLGDAINRGHTQQWNQQTNSSSQCRFWCPEKRNVVPERYQACHQDQSLSSSLHPKLEHYTSGISSSWQFCSTAIYTTSYISRVKSVSVMPKSMLE